MKTYYLKFICFEKKYGFGAWMFKKIAEDNTLNINFNNFLKIELKNQDILKISGENGIGKTTLIRKIATLKSFEQNEIFWNGKDIFKNKSVLSCYRKKISYLGHSIAIKKKLKCY